MTCKDLAPLLGSLGDGSLPPSEKQFAREHLASCTNCRAALERLLELEQRLGAGLAVPDPGEAYYKTQRTRLLQAAARTSAKGSGPAAPAEFRRPRVARFVWAAAAAILILAT